jgi:diketogulonate reductase-like aldo/keto reductase
LNHLGVTGLSNNSPEVIKYRHESWTALSNIKSRGLIRSIGVSNFMIKHLEALKAFSDVKPVLNQVEWHPKCHDPELLKYCNENGILLQAYSSLGTSSDNSLKNDKIIMKIAQELGKSPSQILLKWSVQSGVAIIPKASSMKHLEENINLDFIIPDDKMKILNNFEDRERLDWNPNNVI